MTNGNTSDSTLADAKDEVVIASWNMRYGYDMKTEQPRSIEDIEKSVRRLLTERQDSHKALPGQWVLGLIEHLTPVDGSPSVAAQLAERLGCKFEVLPLAEHYDPKKATETPDDPTQPGFGVAVLSNLPITDVTNKFLGKTGDDPTERYGLQVDLQTKAGRPFKALATHLTYNPMMSAKQVVRMVYKSNLNEGPTVSFGDLNCPRRAVAKIAARYGHVSVPEKGRTWPVSKFYVPELPVIGKAVKLWTRARGKPASVPAIPFTALDHITVSPEASVVDSGIIKGLGSDHDGISAVIDVAAPNARGLKIARPGREQRAKAIAARAARGPSPRR